MVLSVVIIVGQLAMLVLTISLFANNAPALVWYGFPLAAFLFLGAQLVYTYVSSRRQQCRVSGLTLIPYSEGGHSLDCSVPYRMEDVVAVLHQIVAFLEEMKIDKETVFNLNLCLEELMTNIAQHSSGRVARHSFDVHVFVKNQHVSVTLKYGGHPFDPIQAGRAVVTNPDISYKFMYGLNVVLIKV